MKSITKIGRSFLGSTGGRYVPITELDESGSDPANRQGAFLTGEKLQMPILILLLISLLTNSVLVMTVWPRQIAQFHGAKSDPAQSFFGRSKYCYRNYFIKFLTFRSKFLFCQPYLNEITALQEATRPKTGLSGMI